MSRREPEKVESPRFMGWVYCINETELKKDRLLIVYGICLIFTVLPCNYIVLA